MLSQEGQRCHPIHHLPPHQCFWRQQPHGAAWAEFAPCLAFQQRWSIGIEVEIIGWCRNYCIRIGA